MRMEMWQARMKIRRRRAQDDTYKSTPKRKPSGAKNTLEISSQTHAITSAILYQVVAAK